MPLFLSLSLYIYIYAYIYIYIYMFIHTYMIDFPMKACPTELTADLSFWRGLISYEELNC